MNYEKIQEEYNNTKSIDKICEIFNISYKDIFEIIRNKYIKTSKYKIAQEKESIIIKLYNNIEDKIKAPEIIKSELGIQMISVTKALVKHGFVEEEKLVVLTVEDEITIGNIYKKGSNVNELSKNYKVSKHKIVKILKSQNIKIRKTKLTDEQESKILELSKDKNVTEICRIMKINKHHVARVLKENNSKAKNNKINKDQINQVIELYKIHQCSKIVCNLTKMSMTNVSNILEKYGLREKMVKKIFNEFEIEEILYLYKIDNIPITKISRRYKCTYNTIKNLLINNGIDVARWKRKFDVESLKEKYSNKVILKDLAKEYNSTQKTISAVIKENGGEVRNPNFAKFDYIIETTLTEYQFNVLQGFILGDGCVTKQKEGNKNAIFSHTSIHKEYSDYAKTLLPFPNMRSILTEQSKKTNILGKYLNSKDIYTISTRCDKTLTKMRDLWYPEGVKIIPKTLKLTPETVKHWFMDDGYSCYHRKLVDIGLCTNGFTFEDCEFLVQEFDKVGIKFRIRKKMGLTVYQPVLETRGDRESFNFLQYIGQCPVECFKYKWKYGTKYTTFIKS